VAETPTTLAPRDSLAGLHLPLTHGGAMLGAGAAGALVSIAPFRGRDAVVATILNDQLGATLPEPGHVAEGTSGRVIWMGLGQSFAELPETAAADLMAALAPHAAVTDQSDGWAALSLTGPHARLVLARLVPLDLDPAAFPPGSVARTQLRHVICALLATEGGFRILVLRSFARTAVHDLGTAMAAVAARAELAGPEHAF
jgi:heterotetrameric sarcosine oxidase gamma subunit